MAKRRKSSGKGMSKGLIIFLSVVGVLGVGAGTTAIITRGFQQWGEAEAVIKGGVTVDTFTIDSLAGTTATLTNKEGDELAITIDGFIGDNEKLYLGNDETAPDTTKASLEENLAGMGFSNKTIETIENSVCALDVCKYSALEMALNVEYKEENAVSATIELPWFDMVRINYKIPAARYIISGKFNESTYRYSECKKTNTITSLYENISLFALEEDETLSVNCIEFIGFSLQAAKDNTIEIESIDLVRSTAGQHQQDLCWVTQ